MSKAKRTIKHKQNASSPAQDAPQIELPHEPTSMAPTALKLVTEQRAASTSVVQSIAKAAVALAGKDGGLVQVEIMEKLWAMQKDAEDRQAEREFGIAKVALAMELPTIPKNHAIEFVDKKTNQPCSQPYADRVDIESVLDPICRKHGFSKEYSSETVDGKACQVLTVRHVGGHKAVYRSPYMPLDTTGSKNNNQAAGSTAEYGKRYALIGAFNIIGVDKDDDGNKGVTEPTSKGDAFTANVQAEAAKQPEAKKEGMSLPDAAAKLESLIRNAKPENRAAIFTKHFAVIAAMELDDGFKAKALELRALCEEQANVAA